MVGADISKEIPIGTFLLEEYRKEMKTEIDRWDAIEDKANRTFSFSSSVTAVLVGIFSLGESLGEQKMPIFLLIPFIGSYCIGILLFAVSAVFSLLALAISEFKKPYLEHSQSMVDTYFSKTSQEVERILIETSVESLQSLMDKIERKAVYVKYSQYIVFLAVVSIVVSMILIVAVAAGLFTLGV